ncbi:MAG: thioredoxin domain-containing protein, partial [Acidimicrobiia bacterium]
MPNRLANETSPYLRQHMDNPVDWYPWGPEAFEAAKRADKPILLSVGYSACHWCHVMAHESFEDPETAALMNDLFINVKVDREERPDVDSIYMTAVQATTGRGGWPMTVWLTPEAKPFFAGTYFPPQDRHGMPSFRRVMDSVSEAWNQRRDGIEQQADHLVSAITRDLPSSPSIPSSGALASAYRRLESTFDPVHGGFGGAPKFPQQPVIEFLLRAAGEDWAPGAENMARVTLQKMMDGGIRDHIGGGFARYSVDERWEIPHFEKMLYDNAQLARLYLRGWQVTGVDSFKETAVETLEYLIRDLRHADGGFFSAEDADSEGVEGKFYVWDLEELLETTGSAGEAAAAVFGVTKEGNFEGMNHLQQVVSLEEVAARFDTPVASVANDLEEAKAKLLVRRSERVRPGLDDKVVTAWNGLALRAFAEAGVVLGEEQYLEHARRNAEFILRNLQTPDGRLLRSWGQGTAR